MPIFKFFKNLFSRAGKKKAKKIHRRHIKRKKLKNIKPKPRRIRKKKPQKKPLRRKVKKAKKVKSFKKAKKTAVKKVSQKLPEEKEIGLITHYFGKISVGIIKLKAPLAVGELIHIKGSITDFKQVISSMQYNHKDITLAEKGLEIGIKINEPARENDIVYKVI